MLGWERRLRRIPGLGIWIGGFDDDAVVISPLIL